MKTKRKNRDPIISCVDGSWSASKGNIVGSEGAIAFWNYKGRCVTLATFEIKPSRKDKE